MYYLSKKAQPRVKPGSSQLLTKYSTVHCQNVDLFKCSRVKVVRDQIDWLLPDELVKLRFRTSFRGQNSITRHTLQ